MTRRKTLMVMLVASGLCASCTTPSSPTLLSFLPGATTTSVYVGRVEDSTNGPGTATMSLATAQGITSGTVEMSFPDKVEPRRFITGTLMNGAYKATISECLATDQNPNCSGPCQFAFSGLVTPTGVSGNYAANVTRTCSTRTGALTLAPR